MDYNNLNNILKDLDKEYTNIKTKKNSNIDTIKINNNSDLINNKLSSRNFNDIELYSNSNNYISSIGDNDFRINNNTYRDYDNGITNDINERLNTRELLPNSRPYSKNNEIKIFEHKPQFTRVISKEKNKNKE